MSDFYIFNCPHCEDFIQVAKNEVNCAVFRHGYYFIEKDGKIHLTTQINPHLSKNECEKLVLSGKVIGCAKPFRLVKNGDTYRAEVCGYI
jgi:hypothetical protein